MLPVGAFVEGELYPVTDAILSKPFILFFFYLLFSFLFQGLTRGHYLGVVTRADSVTHKHFHRDDKAGS
jgi:hypothetical protein